MTLDAPRVEGIAADPQIADVPERRWISRAPAP